MKKLLLFVIAFITFSSFAQSKISLEGIGVLREIKSEIKAKKRTVQPVIEATVIMNAGWNEDKFPEFDAKIVTKVSDNIIIVEVPANKIEAFAEMPEVFYVEFGKTYKLHLDYARPASKVTEVQTGFTFDNTSVSFDGTGVVTGLMDQGIDPNHINFKTASGANRVKQAYDFTTNVAATSATTVKRFSTDDPQATHGTHVAGIMAGSYNGSGSYCYVAAPTGGSTQKLEGNIPYYGVATNSDIVMCSGRFSDSNIIKGVEAVANYGSFSGKPAVVNLSLGSNSGPHDGSGVLEQAISKTAEKAIVCISAGNEGDGNIFVGKEFTASDTELKTVIKDGISTGIDIWTNSSEPVTVEVFFYTGLVDTSIAKVTAAGQSSSASSAFGKKMSGTLNLVSEVNRLNNRFHVQIQGVFQPSTSGVTIAFSVKGKAGQRVYCYGYDGNGSDNIANFTSANIVGFTEGTNDGSINNVACAENVIAVGAYTTRNAWGTFAGTYKYSSSEYVVGNISPFSSFGTSYQGVVLPTVSAPGANIISSINRYYTNTLTQSQLQSYSALVNDGSMPAYWGPMQGTSMSCPYVSGAVALMLQADPSLKVADVADILKQTAVAPDASLPDIKKKQWGASGRLNTLEAVKEVLNRKYGSVEGIATDVENQLIISQTGSRIFNIALPAASSINATLYNIQGIAVASASAADSEVVLDGSNLSSGVYILSVETPSTSRITRRILIK